MKSASNNRFYLPLGALLSALLLISALPLAAVDLPEGEGKAATEKLCIGCHDLGKAVSLRQDRNGWGVSVQKMITLGAKGSKNDFDVIVDYLAENYPPESLPPLEVNKARAIDLESRFSLKRSEASAILRYKKEHGDFKSLDDLLKVPGIDSAKIEAKKDQLVF